MGIHTTERVRLPGWRRAIRKGVLLLLVLWVGGVAALMFLEVPFVPWARSFGLWPTLTGTWHGELRADGRVAAVYFELRGGMPSRQCVSCPRIRGRAKVCAAGAAIREYDISGDVDSWRGTQFHVALSRVSADETGTGPGSLRGEWTRDEIRATGDLVSHGPVASATATRDTPRSLEPEPSVEYRLRRGSEDAFVAACRGQIAPSGGDR